MAAGTKAIDMFPRTDAKKRFTDINSINPSRVETVVRFRRSLYAYT